jgi:hypothetical protein
MGLANREGKTMYRRQFGLIIQSNQVLLYKFVGSTLMNWMDEVVQAIVQDKSIKTMISSR